MTKHADSVPFCLSKGLSAPVGSVICGSEEFIKKAHRVRKQLGGGMRQAGVLAAAGIVALETMWERLMDDHKNARILGEGLKNIEGIVFDLSSQHTNMVYFSLEEDVPISLSELRSELAQQGLLVGGGSNRVRMVTHAWVDEKGVNSALDIITSVIAGIYIPH